MCRPIYRTYANVISLASVAMHRVEWLPVIEIRRFEGTDLSDERVVFFPLSPGASYRAALLVKLITWQGSATLFARCSDCAVDRHGHAVAMQAPTC